MKHRIGFPAGSRPNLEDIRFLCPETGLSLRTNDMEMKPSDMKRPRDSKIFPRYTSVVRASELLPPARWPVKRSFMRSREKVKKIPLIAIKWSTKTGAQANSTVWQNDSQYMPIPRQTSTWYRSTKEATRCHMSANTH